MKKVPYREYLDLKLERKEYSRLCKSKSKKYRYYSEWEKHIEDSLLKFQTSEDLCNFKHFCINYDRSLSRLPEILGLYFPLIISLYLDRIFNQISVLVWILLLMFYICFWFVQHKNAILESYFYKDILQIVEKVETQIKEKSNPPEVSCIFSNQN